VSRLETWGAELAMLLRREFEQLGELDRTRGKITELSEKIRNAETAVAYGATGEIPRVAGEW
jgi:hypothetical protein